MRGARSGCMNKIESVSDVAELLKFLSGFTGISARIQQECVKAGKVLEGKALPAPTLVLTTGTPATGAVSAFIQQKPWRHSTTQLGISSSGHPMTAVANWLSSSNNINCIVEIEYMAKNSANPSVYDILYRYKA